MARLLVAGILLATAAPLLAQSAPAPMAPMADMGMMANKVVTRGEVQAMVQTRFARVDVNRDGFVTEPEMAAMHGKMREMKMRHRGEKGDMGGHEAMRDPNVAFDRIDANRDGSISRDEFGRARQMRMEKRGEMKQHGKMGAMRGMHGGGGMMGAAMFKTADANRDGKVSLAEATAGALSHFDMMDANRDGRVTPEERAGGRARMMQMHKPG